VSRAYGWWRWICEDVGLETDGVERVEDEGVKAVEVEALEVVGGGGGGVVKKN